MADWSAPLDQAGVALTQDRETELRFELL